MATSTGKGTETNTPVLHWATVSAPTNIAVVKYWGKADSSFNTPINDSLSVTLDPSSLRAVTTVAVGRGFTRDRLWLNGEEDTTAATNNRFRACVDGVKKLATTVTTRDGATVTAEDFRGLFVHVSSYNTFPTAAGLASSAAGYAALVAALAELMQAKEEFDGQLTTIARQGSGSSCRSLYGGFVAWNKGSPPDWLDSKASQVASETHWPEMQALILVVSDSKKETSSTSGMSTSVATSDLLSHRAAAIVPKRMEQVIRAIHERDFGAFAKLTMQDSNQFHATCLDTYPPIFYMNDTSRQIIAVVTAYNEWCGQLRAAYTFDAGPNAVLYVLEQHITQVAALMAKYFSANTPIREWVQGTNLELPGEIAHYALDSSLVERCDKLLRSPGVVKCMYATRVGSGAHATSECNIDLSTGLNTYTP